MDGPVDRGEAVDEGNEMAELHRRFTGVLAASLSAAAQAAGLAMEFYASRLRRAALAGQDQATAQRAVVAAQHRADRQVWRQTQRPGWWRTASAEAIAQAWRVSCTWAEVDPQ